MRRGRVNNLLKLTDGEEKVKPRLQWVQQPLSNISMGEETWSRQQVQRTFVLSVFCRRQTDGQSSGNTSKGQVSSHVRTSCLPFSFSSPFFSFFFFLKKKKQLICEREMKGKEIIISCKNPIGHIFPGTNVTTRSGRGKNRGKTRKQQLTTRTR